jgi:hypothetical protein
VKQKHSVLLKKPDARAGATEGTALPTTACCAVVAGEVQRLVELAGHHVHGQLLGMERPRQARIDAAIEPPHGALAGRGTCAGFATGTALQAHAEHLLAGDAVQRHQRERQQEHRHRHADQARQPGTA